MCPMPMLEWQGLRKGVQAMTTASGESEYTDPVLAAVEAQLFVGDITDSGAYYTSKIGFYLRPPTEIRPSMARSIATVGA